MGVREGGRTGRRGNSRAVGAVAVCCSSTARGRAQSGARCLPVGSVSQRGNTVPPLCGRPRSRPRLYSARSNRVPAVACRPFHAPGWVGTTMDVSHQGWRKAAVCAINVILINDLAQGGARPYGYGVYGIEARVPGSGGDAAWKDGSTAARSRRTPAAWCCARWSCARECCPVWARASRTTAGRDRVEHPVERLVKQRVLGICLGLRGPERPRRTERGPAVGDAVRLRGRRRRGTAAGVGPGQAAGPGRAR